MFLLKRIPGLESWTPSELAAIADAARSNTAVRTLMIDLVHTPTVGEVSVMGRIASHFQHVRAISVCDRDRFLRGVNEAHAHLVDAVLHGMMKSQASLVTLQLYYCCSPNAFREIIERFPHLERCDIEGQGRIVDRSHGDPGYEDFVSAVSHEMRTGRLPSLRHLGLDSSVGTASFFRLLNAAQLSTTIETMRFSVMIRSWKLLADVFHFCAYSCPPTLKRVIIEKPFTDDNEGLLNVASFFPAEVSAPPLAPNIHDVTFYDCRAPSNDGAWVDRAASALKNVLRLNLINSDFPFADLLDRLPQLRKFSCLFREERESAEMYADFVPLPHILDTNDALARFCEVIKRPTSLLDGVELDVIEREFDGVDGVDESKPYSDIKDLLQHSKGQLIVNFANLSPSSSYYVTLGAERLSVRLQELRIRFCRCDIGDNHYASFLRALKSNVSLKMFELGYDTFADLGTPELSIAEIQGLIHDNDTLEELVLRDLGSDAVVAVVERILPSLANKNRSLRKLEFFGLGLADVWPRIRGPLLAALRTNVELYQFGGDVRVPDDDHDTRHLLKMNLYGRRLLLPRDVPVPLGLRATIFARISQDEEHAVMYAFVRATLVSPLHPSFVAENRRGGGLKRSRAEAQGLDWDQADIA